MSTPGSNQSVFDDMPGSDDDFVVDGTDYPENMKHLSGDTPEDDEPAEAGKDTEEVNAGEADQDTPNDEDDLIVEGSGPDDAKPADPGEEEAPQPKKKGNNFQKRIDEKHADFMREKERADALEQELAELKAQKDEAPAIPEEEPEIDDYDTVDDYLKALALWDKAQDAKEAASEEKVENEPAEREPGRNPNFIDGFEDAKKVVTRDIDSWSDKPKDFGEVAFNEEVAISQEMVVALGDLSEPAKVLYWLGQNPDRAMDIASMTQRKAAVELAKIEATEELAPAKKASSKKVTEAPEPINPVDGTSVPDQDLTKMSFKDYKAKMDKEEGESRFW